jgi:hypothetical protein
MKQVVSLIVTLFNRSRLISLLADIIDKAHLKHLNPWRFIEKFINCQRKNQPALRDRSRVATGGNSTYIFTKRFLRRKNAAFQTSRRVMAHPVLYILLSIKRKKNVWGRRRH